jgi:hypothetical protein
MFRRWITKLIVNRVIKLAIKKADITPYVIDAADAVDEYMDKKLGQQTSQQVQDAITDWINKTVLALTDRLKNN